MDDRIVAVQKLLLGHIEPRDHLIEFLLRDVRLIVEHAAIADDQDLILRHELRGFQRKTLLMQLRRYDEILEIEHGKAVAERLDAELRDQLRRRFRHDEHAIADARKLLHKARGQRRFAACRSSGQNDFFDAFHSGSFQTRLGRTEFILLYYTTYRDKMLLFYDPTRHVGRRATI